MMNRSVLILLALVVLFGTGCARKYDVPEFVTIEPSQTAFLVPLVGDTTKQKGFMGEEFLVQAQVATKRIQIPHEWVQKGRWPNQGDYMPTMRVIVVERKPATREWTEAQAEGTSSKDEGMKAESIESIGFMARMNGSAQIDEADATRFLYRYNNKPLEEVMDSEIRARIESKFVEQCARYKLEDLIQKKAEIMTVVRDDVLPYFKERGITITVLGLKGELTYLEPEIQKAINAKFTAAQEKLAQDTVNERLISKAETEAKVAAQLSTPEQFRYQLKLMDYQLRLKELENQRAAIDAWKEKGAAVPTVIGNGSLFSLPFEALKPPEASGAGGAAVAAPAQ